VPLPSAIPVAVGVDEIGDPGAVAPDAGTEGAGEPLGEKPSDRPAEAAGKIHDTAIADSSRKKRTRLRRRPESPRRRFWGSFTVAGIMSALPLEVSCVIGAVGVRPPRDDGCYGVV
jgi:hypothetical protein